MPFQPLNFQPGISRSSTAYNNEGRWYECDKVRFQDGRPEIIGGWQDRGLIGGLLGICRTKLTWRSNAGFIYEAFGTTEGLFVNRDGTIYDITPARVTFTDEADPLSIDNGGSTLTIAATSHGAVIGERVELQGYDLTASGITEDELNRTHVITDTPDANTVTVELAETASSAASGSGGTGDILFLLKPGASGTVFGDGWGAGPYGLEEYGTPRSTVVAASRARVWSLDNWGEILVGTYRDGTPVKWDPTNDGLNTRATEITNAPKADMLVVSTPDRHLVLLSSVLPGESAVNRMCIRWCDQEDFTEWNISATTTAGYTLLGNGSEIVAGQPISRQIMVWTDTAINALQYQGPPFTFGLQPLDKTAEIVSRNAAVEVDGTVMWMGVGAFYVYDGVARVLDCDVQDIVFDNYNLDQREKFFGGHNQEFNEVWWFYVSNASDEIDRYVIFNYKDRTWAYGTMARTAWEDAGINDFPTAVTLDGAVYDHENGTSDNGSALNAYVESAPIDIGEGDFMMYVKGIVPDARMIGASTMEITLKGQRYPQGAISTYGPYTISAGTERVRTRLRVRQVIFRYESDAADLFWQGGKPRLELKPQGRY